MAETVNFGTLNYIIFFIYLAAMFAIGLRLAGKQKNTEDYFLAGRRIPWLFVGMSMFASLTSATTYMGVPGIAYRENISLIVLGILSPIVAPILVWLFYPFYLKLHVTTSYEYINLRYGRPGRFAIAALFMLARLGWLGVVIFSPALALSVVTGVNLWLAILVNGGIAIAYTVLGGLAADIYTDVVQFIILVVGAVWVAVTLVFQVPDGLPGIMRVAAETNHLNVIDWKLSLFYMTGLAVAISTFFQLMQDYGTDQITVQRLLAIRDFRGTVKAVFFNAAMDLCLMSLLLFLGLGMFAYFRAFPDRLLEGLAGDKILPYYIMHALPVGVSGLIVTAIFAAAMSSMDSGINSLATVLINDFIRPLRRKPRTEEQDLRLARNLSLMFGIFGMGVAFYVSTIEQVLKASNKFLGLFAAPVLALFLLGMLTRRAHFWGWLVGTFVGVAFTVWLQEVVKVHFIWYFPFCFWISLVVGYVMSLIIPGPMGKREYTVWGRHELEQRASATAVYDEDVVSASDKENGAGE